MPAALTAGITINSPLSCFHFCSFPIFDFYSDLVVLQGQRFFCHKYVGEFGCCLDCCFSSSGNVILIFF